MSDVMLFGVLRMPYELAMSTELSRRQFYSRSQQAADTIESMTRERDEALADAERYRWLTRPGELIGNNWRTVENNWDGCDGKAGFDAAIDSARSA